MRLPYVLLLFLVAVNGHESNDQCLLVNGSNVCYSALPPDRIARLYGTATTLTDSRHYVGNRTVHTRFPGCEPVMFYMVSRHSIRYPSKKDIKYLNKILPLLQKEIAAGRGSLCEKDRREILAWKSKMTLEDDNNISPSGFQETSRLACEYFNKYPDLLDPKKTNIEVGVSRRVRTNQTADAFIAGLTDQKICPKLDHSKAWNPEKVAQPHLFFHRLCDEMYAEHGGKKKASKQVEKFKKSKLVKKLSKDIKRRLGLKTSLDFPMIQLLGKACSFEYALYRYAPWCAAFGDNNMKVLEYFEDLKSYVDGSYGNPRHKSACLLVRHLVEKLKLSAKQEQDNKRSYLYFSHGGGMKKIWAALGLFRYDEFLVDKSSEHGFCSRKSRPWRTSLHTPFGTHIVFVLHKCTNAVGPEYKIATYVDGFEVLVNGCSSNPCSLESFLKANHEIAANCDLSNTCKPKKHNSNRNPHKS